jgi:hypothetical protein
MINMHSDETIRVAAPVPAQLIQFGQKRAEAILDLQKELLDACDEAGRDWVTRFKSEVELWSELSTKLATTQSITEGAEAVGECLSQRMQLAAEDGQRLVHEGQKVVGTVTRSLFSWWPTANKDPRDD